jgi:hypothetical protein
MDRLRNAAEKLVCNTDASGGNRWRGGAADVDPALEGYRGSSGAGLAGVAGGALRQVKLSTCR